MSLATLYSWSLGPSVRGLPERALHKSFVHGLGGLEIKRVENVTEAWIISNRKPPVCERDKSRRVQPCSCLLTHNGAVSHTNSEHDIFPGSAVLSHHDLLVTISLYTTTCLCRYIQTHSGITPKHVKNLLTLRNTLTKTCAGLECPNTGKFRSAWLISVGACRRSDEGRWTQPPQGVCPKVAPPVLGILPCLGLLLCVRLSSVSIPDAAAGCFTAQCCLYYFFLGWFFWCLFYFIFFPWGQPQSSLIAL